jgi:hypothetical protein
MNTNKRMKLIYKPSDDFFVERRKSLVIQRECLWKLLGKKD